MMNVLALECSTDKASLALMTDGVVAASQRMEAGHRRSQELFAAVETLIRSAGWTFRDIGAFAVGRGPGAYTGLRVSLTAAHGWALPDNKPVWTVSSGAALAAEHFAGHPEDARAVAWGHARRGMIWAGRFARRGDGLEQEGDWSLLPAEAQGRQWADVPWTAPGRIPQAEWVGRLFVAGGASEDRQPVYLNPAVTVAPRFDAAGRPITA